MSTTPLTLVGYAADALAPLLTPSPTASHEAKILDVYAPDLGYDAEKFLYKPP